MPVLPTHTAGSRRRQAGAAVVLAATAATLAGCSPIVDVEPAPDAANPDCARVMVVLPDLVADNELRETNSQATAAWGDPSKVVLRCGVPVPGPTTDQCVGVNGVDWVIQEGDPYWTMTTYGRNPATEVLIDPNQVASSTVLVDLSAAVAEVPQTNKCLGPAQTLPG
jgi:hypothetical protein